MNQNNENISTGAMLSLIAGSSKMFENKYATETMILHAKSNENVCLYRESDVIICETLIIPQSVDLKNMSIEIFYNDNEHYMIYNIPIDIIFYHYSNNIRIISNNYYITIPPELSIYKNNDRMFIRNKMIFPVTILYNGDAYFKLNSSETFDYKIIKNNVFYNYKFREFIIKSKMLDFFLYGYKEYIIDKKTIILNSKLVSNGIYILTSSRLINYEIILDNAKQLLTTDLINTVEKYINNEYVYYFSFNLLNFETVQINLLTCDNYYNGKIYIKYINGIQYKNGTIYRIILNNRVIQYIMKPSSIIPEPPKDIIPIPEPIDIYSVSRFSRAMVMTFNETDKIPHKYTDTNNIINEYPDSVYPREPLIVDKNKYTINTIILNARSNNFVKLQKICDAISLDELIIPTSIELANICLEISYGDNMIYNIPIEIILCNNINIKIIADNYHINIPSDLVFMKSNDIMLIRNKFIIPIFDYDMFTLKLNSVINFDYKIVSNYITYNIDISKNVLNFDIYQYQQYSINNKSTKINPRYLCNGIYIKTTSPITSYELKSNKNEYIHHYKYCLSEDLIEYYNCLKYSRFHYDKETLLIELLYNIIPNELIDIIKMYLEKVYDEYIYYFPLNKINNEYNETVYLSTFDININLITKDNNYDGKIYIKNINRLSYKDNNINTYWH